MSTPDVQDATPAMPTPVPVEYAQARPAQPAPVARLRVVIVNYRTPGLTLDCLDSLQAQVKANPGTHVVVVEGGSGDDSAEQLRQGIASRGFGDWVTLDVREQNAGFAGGNNAAIDPAMAEANPPQYVLLLNPDTVVRDGAVTTLLEFMDAHPRAGLAGSRLEDPDGTPQRSAFRFPSLRSEFENVVRLGIVSKLVKNKLVAPPIRNDQHLIEWAAGASLIVRREVFETVGSLDANYFMYYEELDFCLAAHRAGFECWYVPESRVVHLVGQASGVTAKHEEKKRSKRRPAYWFESRRRFWLKNHGPITATLADGLYILGMAVRRVRGMVTGYPVTDPERFYRDFIRHSVFMKGVRL